MKKKNKKDHISLKETIISLGTLFLVDIQIKS